MNEIVKKKSGKKQPATAVHAALADRLQPISADSRVDNPVQAYGVAPTGVVKPADREDLQQLVRTCADTRTALVPVSSRATHRKTGLCCTEPHLWLDLSDWKGIPFVSRRNRVAQLEAGVTYGEALAALAPHGLTLPMPLAPRSGKSVLAACCERQPVTWSNKQWESSDPLACMEFVFGTGDLFRTGSAGGPGSLERQRAVGQAQKAPLGPGATDFHRLIQGSQGSFGIATWITVRAELLPRLEQPWLIGAESLSRLCAFQYDVQRVKWGEEAFILNRSMAAQLYSAQEGGAFDSLYESLPEWICLQNVAGFERLPAQRLAYQQADIRRLAEQHALQPVETLGRLTANGLLQAARRPCGDTDWRHALRGNSLSFSFQTTLDRSEHFIALALQTLLAHGPACAPLGVYVQPVVQNRACEVELLLPYDPADAEQVAQVARQEHELFARLNAAHAFFSRPYGVAAREVFANNPLNTRFLQKLKTIFDPHRILNPGKFGF